MRSAPCSTRRFTRSNPFTVSNACELVECVGEHSTFLAAASAAAAYCCCLLLLCVLQRERAMASRRVLYLKAGYLALVSLHARFVSWFCFLHFSGSRLLLGYLLISPPTSLLCVRCLCLLSLSSFGISSSLGGFERIVSLSGRFALDASYSLYKGGGW